MFITTNLSELIVVFALVSPFFHKILEVEFITFFFSYLFVNFEEFFHLILQSFFIEIVFALLIPIFRFTSH